MWGKEEVLPFAYVRGQNVELAKADDPKGIENRVASATEQSSLKEEVYQGQLESVLLAGEYIVPKRRLRTASYPCKSAVSSDTRADKDRSGDSSIDTSVAGDRIVAGVEGDRWQKTLLIGGTHEYAVTMTELEAPPDIEKASDLLMDKMLSMYPALKKEGWEPFRCAAGELTNGRERERKRKMERLRKRERERERVRLRKRKAERERGGEVHILSLFA